MEIEIAELHRQNRRQVVAAQTVQHQVPDAFDEHGLGLRQPLEHLLGKADNSGGGGGSNLVPAGGTAALDENGAAPSVTITYTAVPTSIGQCKKNGWKNFGTMFKNQGQCVKFVEEHA